MNRIAKPAASKVDFELFCLAVSAINGCESCIKAHEKTVLAGGLSEDQVHDAVRIAAVIQGAAVALDLVPAHAVAPPPATAPPD
jgi:alkyl hydroperoxide reductase subunit D